jgi:putative sigma-54 modulation protein
MGVEWTGRNVEVTPPLRAFAKQRAARLERHLGGPANVRVILSREKNRNVAEVIASYRDLVWTAKKEETGDPRAALTLAFEKIEAQAMKDSTKRHDHKHRSAAAVAPLLPADGKGDKPSRRRVTPTPSGNDRRIVRVGKRGAAKPMTVEEAAMRIDSSREDVVVFRDSGSERISVLYKRRDGDFGLIVPE